MIKIYHAASSVCSQKVRIVLSEKSIEWESVDINLQKGEQITPDYLKLNPEGVVPTLITDDGFVVRESSVIIEYLDQLKLEKQLMPKDVNARFLTKLWLIRTIEIHAAINSMSFATMMRDKILTTKNAEEVEQWVSSFPNPQIADKRRDLMKNGAASVYVDGAIHTLMGMFKDMSAALNNSKWLAGEEYSLADAALIAYVDRLDKLSMSGLWNKKYPSVSKWLSQSRSRPSYNEGVTKYDNPDNLKSMKLSGKKAWPIIVKRLQK